MDISKKTFISAVIILLVLLISAGILTRILPMGQYEYEVVNNVETMIPNSFHFIDEAPLKISAWFLAPIAVLFTDEGVIVISIILFLMIIGGAIHVLNEVKVLETLIQKIVNKFKNNKRILIRIMTFIFMALGAFVGIFEEIIPLVPMIIALSIALGYDVFMGLGMSVLATGLGFAAAISNPFTIGVAQKISSVPMFSGAGYRFIIFIVVYIILNIFLDRYGKKIEKETKELKKFKMIASSGAMLWFLVTILLLIVLIILSPFVPLISSYNLPLIGLLFLFAGLGCGFLSKKGWETFKLFGLGALNMFPAVILILLATGIKHIIQTGHIMDTILFYASEFILNSSSIVAILIVYALVLFLNFFIGSGSAKAFIVMPIIAPLMDMIGISRQMAVLAFQFGDGFSNILYPTNAVLLISLGLAGISYTKWFKWIIKLQLVLVVMSFIFLAIGLAIGY